MFRRSQGVVHKIFAWLKQSLSMLNFWIIKKIQANLKSNKSLANIDA